MATPFVTGAVALMIAKHRDEGSHTPVNDVFELREHLSRTAQDAGSTGKDPSYGFGLISPASILSTPPREDRPIWTGMRIEFDISGTPAVAVLAPRTAQVTIDTPASHAIHS
jgi:hypothetical protein